MKKYIISNWINLLYTVIGFYIFLLISAITSLYGDTRGLNFETVFIETLGGSLAYTFSYIISVEPATFLIYIVLLIVTSIITFKFISKVSLVKAIMTDAIVITIAMLLYLLPVKNYEMLYLIVLHWLSQFIRYKKLSKIQGSHV